MKCTGTIYRPVWTLLFMKALPGQVLDLTVYLAGAELAGKHDDLILRIECSVNEGGEVTGLTAYDIHGNAHRGKSLDVHQYVVDKILDPAVEAAAEYHAEGDAIDTSKRMVGHEGETGVIRKTV